MPEHLLLPWVSLSILVLLIAAVLVARQTTAARARQAAVAALSISFALLLAALFNAGRAVGQQFIEPLFGGLFRVDALNTIPLPLYAALALGVTIFAPRRKVTTRWLTGVLLLTAATLTAYAADNLLLLVVAWASTIAPFLFGFFNVTDEEAMPPLAKWALIASTLSLIIGALLLAGSAPGADWHEALSLAHPRAGRATPLRWAFVFLMLAVVLRKGLLPTHSWTLAAFERGPLLPLMLLVNGHLGAFLTARLTLPVFPDVARAALPLLGDLGLATAAYTAVLALMAREPRRLLALISISQSSFVLVGLVSNHADGIAGALVLWQVVAVATMMLAAVYAALEARLGTTLNTSGLLGLALGAPRLAVFFAAGALALVGLPLTLGFCAEDLLLHGTLASHPHLGVLMPLVTALNAFVILRLFARLFLGQPSHGARNLADALPRERWVLTMALLFLLLGGLLPGRLVQLPVVAADRLAALAAKVYPTHNNQQH